MFSKPTRNYKAVFSINENKHAIKHNLNYEITKDTNNDEFSIHENRPHARISKRDIKEKKILPLQLKGGKIKKEVSINRLMVHRSEVANNCWFSVSRHIKIKIKTAP